MQKSTLILGLIREFHSDQTYKALEAAADGVIDLKVEELGKTVINLMRIRNLRNVVFSSEWRKLNVAGENFEVTLEK
jgi:archaellum biogenesis ATPase FlaH